MRQLPELLDGELSDTERRAVEQHLGWCIGCRSRAEFERLLKQKLNELGSTRPSAAAAAFVSKLLNRLTAG